jgi:hypothetical protein
MFDDFISFAEAANNFDLDVATVTQLVKASGLMLFRIERGNRQVSRAELEALVERRRVELGTASTPTPQNSPV